MALSEEEKERRLKYFELVGSIHARTIYALKQAGATDESIAASELDILKRANQQAGDMLGYSYYPYTRNTGDN